MAARHLGVAVFGRKTALGLLTGALALTGVVGGGAAVWAAGAKPAQGGETIQACVGPHNILRLAGRAGCHDDGLISWNVTGPAGPPGPSLNPTVVQATLAPSPFVLSFAPTAAPLSITLPADGTYLINANVRGRITFLSNATPHECRIEAQLRTAPGSPIPDSLRVVLVDTNNLAAHRSNMEATAPISTIFTGTAGTVVTLAAEKIGANCPALPAGVALVSGIGGMTTLNAVRIQ